MSVTVEPRFNTVAWDWLNLFVKASVCYIQNLTITSSGGLNCSLYPGRVNDWFVKVCLHRQLMSSNSMQFATPRSAMLVQLITAFWDAKIKGFSSLLGCSLLIFCHVLALIRYVKVDFRFGLLDHVCYKGNRYYIYILFHMFHCNFGRAEGCCLGILRTLLNRGSLNQGVTVL